MTANTGWMKRLRGSLAACGLCDRCPALGPMVITIGDCEHDREAGSCEGAIVECLVNRFVVPEESGKGTWRESGAMTNQGRHPNSGIDRQVHEMDRPFAKSAYTRVHGVS